MQGTILNARHIYDALLVERDRLPKEAKGMMRSGDIQQALKQRNGIELSSESIRQILRALKAGGLPIESAKSAGYWLKESGVEVRSR